MLIAIKIIHVLSAFTWIGALFAGLFAMRVSASGADLAMQVRKGIGVPALIVLACTGAFLWLNLPISPSLGWFHMKLTFVLLLVICDYFLGKRIESKKVFTKLRFFSSAAVIWLLLAGILTSSYVVRDKKREWKYQEEIKASANPSKLEVAN